MVAGASTRGPTNAQCELLYVFAHRIYGAQQRRPVGNRLGGMEKRLQAISTVKVVHFQARLRLISDLAAPTGHACSKVMLFGRTRYLSERPDCRSANGHHAAARLSQKAFQPDAMVDTQQCNQSPARMLYVYLSVSILCSSDSYPLVATLLKTCPTSNTLPQADQASTFRGVGRGSIFRSLSWKLAKISGVTAARFWSQLCMFAL